jgi:hypothetical protein
LSAFIVVPIQFDAAVEVTCPIFGEFVFCFNIRDQVINVFLTLKFNSKIVDNKREGNQARGVFSEARCIGAFVISIGGKAYL